MMILQSPNDQLEQKELRTKIDYLRAELIKTGMANGFQSVQTIEISQKLDKHIIQYQIAYQTDF